MISYHDASHRPVAENSKKLCYVRSEIDNTIYVPPHSVWQQAKNNPLTPFAEQSDKWTIVHGPVPTAVLLAYHAHCFTALAKEHYA